MTRKDLDILHEQYCRLAAVAENNIGEPGEDEFWATADHFWERVVLPAKSKYEFEPEMDAAYADLLDTGQTLEEMTRR